MNRNIQGIDPGEASNKFYKRASAISFLVAASVPAYLFATECGFSEPAWVRQFSNASVGLCLKEAVLWSVRELPLLFLPPLLAGIVFFVCYARNRRLIAAVRSFTAAPAERTSKAQFLWITGLLARALRGIGRHLRRFGAIYSFLAGIAATLLTLGAIIWYGVFAYPLPWKVTDPTDPRFNPQEFRFTDYENKTEFGDTLRVMFPVGTPKEEVDNILKEAGARVKKYPGAKNEDDPPNLYYYTYRNIRSIAYEIRYMTSEGDFSWKAGIYYDAQNHLTRIVAINP